MRSAGGVWLLGVIHRARLHKWTSRRGSDRKRWDLRFSLTGRGKTWGDGAARPCWAGWQLSRVGVPDAVDTAEKFPRTWHEQSGSGSGRADL